ncbi:hypothetical protein DPMN_112526 [Dreissena polymorpha]|uniref:Uncharacterized protein n=1 Tax=Dreissena polymorpha TaxID=45954 RepID=A0A9D4KGI5_DREPO|nr:hypothetical protein DPMN_112526 [Dreissena polymorpha]
MAVLHLQLKHWERSGYCQRMEALVTILEKALTNLPERAAFGLWKTIVDAIYNVTLAVFIKKD